MNGKITALKIQTKNPQRVNIYLDGEFAFGLSKIVATWLQVGQDLDDEKISSLLEKDQHEAVYQRALKYISYRERSERELRSYLGKLELSEQVIEAVLDRLVRADLINDQRFALMWVENRNEFRPRSQRALAIELHQHGISDITIDEVLAEVDEESNAYRAAMKQAKKYSGLEWIEFRNKIYTYLARHGYNYEIITSTITKVWEEKSDLHSKLSINEVTP
jgi:regulatory protein